MSKKAEDVIFALQPGTVQIGDVILTSDYGWKSFGIRKSTKSDFSHAALCTRSNILLEATGVGVLRRSVIGTMAHRSEWIKVLRPKRPLLANEVGSQLADHAEAIYGRPYSVRGAVASLYPFLGSATDGGVFCSEVIAQAYLGWGVTLLPRKLPSQVYPAMLLNSTELTDVTVGCIRRLSSITTPDLYSEVIATAENELPSDEMRMNRRVFNAIRKRLVDLLPAHICSLTELYHWLSQDVTSEAVRQADALIPDILEEMGFVKWYDTFSMDCLGLAATYGLAAVAAEQVGAEPLTPEELSLISDLKEIIELGETSLEARGNTHRECEDLANCTGLKTFDRLRCIYAAQYQDAKRLQEALIRFVTALDARSQA